MMKKNKYIAYIQTTTIRIEAISIEEAWEKYEQLTEPLKEKGFYFEDIDIIKSEI